MRFFQEYRQLNNSEVRYLLFFAFVWTSAYFDTLWRRLFHITDVATSDLISFVVLVLLAVCCHRQWAGRVRISDYGIYVSCVVFYFASGILYPQTENLLTENAVRVVFATLPYLLVGQMFRHKDYAYWLKISCYFAVLLNIVVLFARSDGGEEDSEESMRKSYLLLPSVLYLFYTFMEKKSIADLVFFAVGFIMLCSYGSRGPFVCTIFFAAAYLFFFRDYSHPWIVRITVTFIAWVLYMMSQFFAEFMIVVLSSLGFKSRIFDKILQDALINYEASNGRNELHERLFSVLNNDSSGVGFGLFSDRIELGGYAHNVLVEIWFDFGYYIGSAIMLAFIIYLLRFFKNTADNSTKVFALILFCASFLKLQFSGSYLMDSNLYFLIGVCIYSNRQTKNPYIYE